MPSVAVLHRLLRLPEPVPKTDLTAMSGAEGTLSGNHGGSPKAKDEGRRASNIASRLSQENDVDNCMTKLKKVHGQWTQLLHAVKESIGNATSYSSANILLDMATAFGEGDEEQKLITALQKISLNEEETNEEIKESVIWPADTFCDFKIGDYEAEKLRFEAKRRSSKNDSDPGQRTRAEEVMFKLPCSSTFKFPKKENLSRKNVANETKLIISRMNKALEDATIEYMQLFKRYFELLKREQDFMVSEFEKLSSLEE